MNKKIVGIFKTSSNEIGYHIENNYDGDGKQIEWKLNLDTLGRLCKEWCFKQGYFLQSGKNNDINWYAQTKECGDWNIHMFWESYIEPTEIEAIIKTTKWVAKEKGLL
jgi:hypothetical protein